MQPFGGGCKNFANRLRSRRRRTICRKIREAGFHSLHRLAQQLQPVFIQREWLCHGLLQNFIELTRGAQQIELGLLPLEI